jgi:hypothetical protein
MNDETIINLADRRDTNRRTTDAWEPEELLYAMCASLSRRVVDSKIPDACLEWCVSEDGAAAMLFYYADCGTTLRFFQKENGFVVGQLELDRYLLSIGKANQLNPDVKKYQQDYNKVSGRTIRECVCAYFPKSLLLTSELLFNHHLTKADEIIGSWYASDFSYVITGNHTNPMRCPSFDWDFIHWLKVEHQKTLFASAVDRSESNLLDYNSGDHKYG